MSNLIQNTNPKESTKTTSDRHNDFRTGVQDHLLIIIVDSWTLCSFIHAESCTSNRHKKRYQAIDIHGNNYDQ